MQEEIGAGQIWGAQVYEKCYRMSGGVVVLMVLK